MWQKIVGHDAIREQFARALARERLASSYLFVGPEGIGKRAFALKLAQALLCSRRPAEALDPCGACEACQQVVAGTHADLLLVAKPEEKSELPLELFIGDREHRMQIGLCHDIGLKPLHGARRVAIVDDADLLTEEAANCLLKTLEEPPPGSVLILIGTAAERQLPTIRSRCQVIRFHPPSLDEAADLIAAHLGLADRDEALRLARHAEGSIERARQLASAELWAFRERLVASLAKLPSGSVGLAGDVSRFVEEAGKEPVVRRARLRQTIDFAIDYYRARIRRQEMDLDAAAALLERCTEALRHLDRNANLATLTECWIDDLARVLRGEWIGVGS